MVGFVPEEFNQGSKLKNSDDLDSSFADSFLDFGNISDWIEEMSGTDGVGTEKVEVGGSDYCAATVEEGLRKESIFRDTIVDGSDGCRTKLEGGGSVELENLGSLIEEELGKVSLENVPHVDRNGAEGGEDLVNNVNGVKRDDLVGGSGGESESSSESEGTTSSSGSGAGSGDDDSDKEEEEEVGGEKKGAMGLEGEMEEGEIRDDDGHDDGEEEGEEDELEMIGGSDDDQEDDGGGGALKGAIKSRNEIEILPPVPPLDVTLQPYHQTLPVGVVLSILGAKVIVEGVEKHNPLNEGSILWITESRSPLGLVDEIFGPVKNPYYVVRYNSDNEVPAGIGQGTPISFVPEFANHVLNDNNLYKKGYDASGENDEEVSDLEFSDDEKEAEYKRSFKMTKRGTNDQKPGNKKNRKKIKNRDGDWKNGQSSTGGSQVTPDQNQHHMLEVAASLDHGSCLSPFGTGQFHGGGSGLVPPYQQMAQVTGFIPPTDAVWANGTMPGQQQQNTVFPNGFPADAMPWFPQNQHQHPFQMPVPNATMFQQQFDPGHMPFSNVVFSCGQPNFLARSAYPLWPGLAGHSGLNQTPFRMGLQSQQTHPNINMGEQGPVGQSCDFKPPGITQGAGTSSGRGNKPYHRGGGRFAGGRGRGGRGRGRDRQQSK